jgi:predicted unusual protein kinase regulating ubiquinone biosynthesis (AarF/ABC1/UbiB family)
MAAMSASVAGSYMGYMMQRAFLSEEKRGSKLKSAHKAAGKRMRDDMQSMRGPAMKLGQMLSLQAGVLPDETLAELSSLQMEAPGMHASLVRAQFKVSMGVYPEECYEEFDPSPFAAASLGQVHRALTHEGETVAVKIQYPGIRDAIAHDFSWFRTVTKPAQLSGHVPAAVIDELEKQIVAETDYVREAANTIFFRERLQPLSFVSVPVVHPRYSSDKVLTMSLLPGRQLDTFLAAKPSQKLRDKVGMRLFELYYFQLLRVGAFHADPHWGNYLFNADGTIGLVDFGCVKYLTPDFVQHLKAVYLYEGPRDSPAFRELVAGKGSVFADKPSPAAARALVRFSQNFYGKVYPPEASGDNQVFDFSNADFLQDYMRESQNLAKSKGALPEYLMLARAEMGLYHTLHRLRARVHTSKIVRKYLNATVGVYDGDRYRVGPTARPCAVAAVPRAPQTP